jgi:hypothetical protein
VFGKVSWIAEFTKREDGSAVKFVDLRLKEIIMARFKHEGICRGYGCPYEVFSLVLPAILLNATFELYCRSGSLFSLLALPLDILAMCTFISLNVLETTLAVPYGIKLGPCSATMCGASCFPCHVLSPFYLSVDGLTLLNGYQPFKCYEGIHTGKNAPAFSVRIQPIRRRSSKRNSLSLNTPSYLFLG